MMLKVAAYRPDEPNTSYTCSLTYNFPFEVSLNQIGYKQRITTGRAITS